MYEVASLVGGEYAVQGPTRRSTTDGQHREPIFSATTDPAIDGQGESVANGSFTGERQRDFSVAPARRGG